MMAHKWQGTNGDGLEVSGNKPLPVPLLAKDLRQIIV